MNIQKTIRKVINEIKLPSETLSKNPIKYYFVNFLDQKKIHFDGLYLHPLFLDDFIRWTIENPKDYSYNDWVIKDYLQNEFKFFCDITNANYERFRTHADSNGVDFDVFGRMTNLKITDNKSGHKRDGNPKTFISEMSEDDYDMWRDKQYMILSPMFNVLGSNRRFYDNDYDYVDLTMIPL